MDSKLQAVIDSLNPSQHRAATLGDEHALVLAGAGCGKTATITARASYLIGMGIEPSKIQILTFTNKSADELVHRIKSVIGEQAEGIGASTFHTWAMGLIRQAPHFFGNSGATIIDPDDQSTLMKMARAEYVPEGTGSKLGYELPKSPALISFYSYLLNTFSDYGITFRSRFPDLADFPEAAVTVREIFKRYRRMKKDRNLLDYDDLLHILSKTLQADPEAVQWLSSQIDYIMVDEFQDSNPLQLSILDPLKNYLTLYVVGDDCQSIYRFRGADVKTIHSFKDRVPGSIVLKLEQNYRSVQEVLDISNWLLNESPLGYDRNLKANRGKGKLKPAMRTFLNQYDEADWLCQDIVSRKRSGQFKYRDLMVIVRSSYAARALESRFLAKKVPYQFIGGSKLLQTSHVRDVLSLFRMICNYKDDLASVRFLTLFKGIGDKAATKIIEQMAGQPDGEAGFDALMANLKTPTAAKKALLAVQDANSIPDAVNRAIAALEPTLKENYPQDWDKRKRDFDTIRILAANYTSLEKFVEDCILDPAHMSSKAEDGELMDCVTIITVHSAKGMESPVCYVINASSGSYPSAKSMESEDTIEEERRVLYVALTRAKDELIITRQGIIRQAEHGNIDYFGLSDDMDLDEQYFLRKCPRALYDHYDHTSPKQTIFGASPGITNPDPKQSLSAQVPRLLGGLSFGTGSQIGGSSPQSAPFNPLRSSRPTIKS